MPTDLTGWDNDALVDGSPPSSPMWPEFKTMMEEEVMRILYGKGYEFDDEGNYVCPCKHCRDSVCVMTANESELLVGWSHLCHGERGCDVAICRVVVVRICKFLGLWAGISFGSKCGGRYDSCFQRNGLGFLVKLLDVPLLDEAQAQGKKVVKGRWFVTVRGLEQRSV
jgi:hypothetical protein